ncbi:MAG: DUF692 domain-containing protein [Acidobacteriota bacterium]
MKVSRRLGYPNLGLGIGLRTVHFAPILATNPPIDWFEVISENFMDSQGRPRWVLSQIAERYPIVLHGVSMSIGSTDPLNLEYLKRLKALATEIGAVWISDHLCWTGVTGLNSHDLLPLPLDEATLRHVSSRVKRVQEFLERPLVLENPSSYVTFAQSTIDEPDFLRALAEETGCGLLLDVNNVYVSCTNHDLDPADYIRRIPAEHVVQFHVAGHTTYSTHIIDTHDHPVIDPVWKLFALAHQLTGGVSTLLEWDANIPALEVVHAEVLKAKHHMSGLHESIPVAQLPSAFEGPPPAPHPLHLTRVEVE